MNQVTEKILTEIRDYGPISFARFMEFALYCPVYGFYEKEEDTVGRRGDYYTSVSVGSLFGELLALRFADWLEQLEWVASLQPEGVLGFPGGVSEALLSPARRRLQIVEAGAHNGSLARDILSWMKAQRPTVYASIEYCIVEPSVQRQEWQRRTLAQFLDKILWMKDLNEFSKHGLSVERRAPWRPIRGVIFSNELLDALPVNRLGWDASRRSWFEWGVTFSDGRFRWTGLRGSVPLVDPPAWPQEILHNLPDEFTVEVCPAANRWWADAAGLLDCGWLLTVDYGLLDDELLSPQRTAGTLRGYRRHHLAADVLADPGEQDITAHVNFSALRLVGEMAGLTTEILCSQEQFMTRIAAPVLSDASPFGLWTSERIRQFQTLTHPDHLGRVFRVLVQSRVREPLPKLGSSNQK